MKQHIITLLIVLLAASTAANAQEFGKSKQFTIRLGYNIGGNAPLGLPASIRRINSYSPGFSPSLGFDCLVPIDTWRAFQVGLRIESKEMREDATVKNYHMEIIKGDQILDGMFTGDEYSRATQWIATMPIQAVFRVKRVNIKIGPYLSYLFHGEFEGYAHNGYLRVGNPTGAKVELGESETERGNFDFSDKMSRLQVGLSIGADWRFSNRFGAYGELNLGTSNTFTNSFRTIEQILRPIYASVGLTYRLR